MDMPSEIYSRKVLRGAETETARFYLLEGDVVWIRYNETEEEFGLAEAKRHTEVLDSLNDGNPVHVVVDFRGLDIAFTPESREYFAASDAHGSVRASQAIILSGLAHKIVANFYLKFNKPACPARIFYNPEDAFSWTDKLRQQKGSDEQPQGDKKNREDSVNNAL